MQKTMMQTRPLDQQNTAPHPPCVQPHDQQSNRSSENLHQSQVKAVRSKQKVPSAVASPEQNFKFAEQAGFTKYEFDLFEDALGGGNTIVHELWWHGMREDFLNQPVWNDQAEHALMMMCKDGLGPALETILGNHSEWKRIIAKWDCRTQ
jgi:hypothetical protein